MAEDTKLKRNVALGFLPHHFGDSRDIRVRFVREAQAAATISDLNKSLKAVLPFTRRMAHWKYQRPFSGLSVQGQEKGDPYFRTAVTITGTPLVTESKTGE